MNESARYVKYVVVITSIALLAVLYYVFHPVHKAEAPQEEATTTTTPATQSISVSVRTEHKSASATLGIKAYTTDIDRPVVFDMDNKNIEKHINTQIDVALSDIQKSFKTDLKEWDTRKSVDTSTLYVTATSTVAQGKTVSIRLSIETYLAESTHPSSREVTLNFTLDTGKLLTLQDIFKGEYLPVLSSHAKAVLTARFGTKKGTSTDGNTPPYTDTFGAGSDPKEENYKNFMIKPNGFDIIFDKYQVAAGYEGPQEVLIPWSELQEILKLK